MLKPLFVRPLPDHVQRAHRAAGYTDDALPAFVLARAADRWPAYEAVVDLARGRAEFVEAKRSKLPAIRTGYKERVWFLSKR